MFISAAGWELARMSTRECVSAGPLPRLTAQASHSSATGRQEKVFQCTKAAHLLRSRPTKYARSLPKQTPKPGHIPVQGTRS